MKITHSVRYAASVDQVCEMLTDPDFRERATLAQGAISASATVAGGRVTVDARRPDDEIPAFARKLIGDVELHITQTEDWADDVYEALMTIATTGLPASIRGTRSLVEDGDGTLDVFEGEATAKVPLLGGRIEKLLADKLAHGWDAEHRVGVAWLQGDR